MRTIIFKQSTQTIKTISIAALTLLLSFVLLISLTACSAADSKGYKLVRSGTLTVVTSADAEPFEYWQDGQIVGFDSALAQELAS
ncbi:MAG: hypothetical protein ACI4BI_04450, partial [Anaerotardibacter sp.]